MPAYNRLLSTLLSNKYFFSGLASLSVFVWKSVMFYAFVSMVHANKAFSKFQLDRFGIADPNILT